MPSKPVNGEQRGWIIPIGGAEDKETNPRILARFVELSGGADADIEFIVDPSDQTLWLNEGSQEAESVFAWGNKIVRGAADIAVRTTHLGEPSLIYRFIDRLAYGVFADAAYLKRFPAVLAEEEASWRRLQVLLVAGA